MRDVYEFIFGTQLPETHDSVEDARAALKTALYLILHGPAPPVPRRGKAPAAINPACLLVHRIPEGLTDQQIGQMIVAHTHVIPTEVAPITFTSSTNAGSTDKPNKAVVGKSTVTFASATHANLAFDSISGPIRPDKQNHAQKRVYMKGGGYIYIRKMIADESAVK